MLKWRRCKEWMDGNNRSIYAESAGLDAEGVFDADSGHQTGTVKTTGVSHTSAPPAAWQSRPVSHSVSQYLCEGKQLVPIAAVVSAKEEQRRKSGRRCCASVHLVLVDCCVKASADSRSVSLATKYGSLG